MPKEVSVLFQQENQEPESSEFCFFPCMLCLVFSHCSYYEMKKDLLLPFVIARKWDLRRPHSGPQQVLAKQNFKGQSKGCSVREKQVRFWEAYSGQSEVGLENQQNMGLGNSPPPANIQDLISQFSPLVSLVICVPSLHHLFTHISPQLHRDSPQDRSYILFILISQSQHSTWYLINASMKHKTQQG